MRENSDEEGSEAEDVEKQGGGVVLEDEDEPPRSDINV